MGRSSVALKGPAGVRDRRVRARLVTDPVRLTHVSQTVCSAADCSRFYGPVTRPDLHLWNPPRRADGSRFSGSQRVRGSSPLSSTA